MDMVFQSAMIVSNTFKPSLIIACLHMQLILKHICEA